MSNQKFNIGQFVEVINTDGLYDGVRGRVVGIVPDTMLGGWAYNVNDDNGSGERSMHEHQLKSIERKTNCRQERIIAVLFVLVACAVTAYAALRGWIWIQ